MLIKKLKLVKLHMSDMTSKSKYENAIAQKKRIFSRNWHPVGQRFFYTICAQLCLLQNLISFILLNGSKVKQAGLLQRYITVIKLISSFRRYAS